MGRCTACSCRTSAIRPRSRPISPRLEKRSIGTETSYLQLSKGVLLRPQSAGDSAMVTFRRLHHRPVAVHARGQRDEKAARAHDGAIDGARRKAIARIRPCSAISAANCSIAWRARSMLLPAVSSLSRRWERRARPVRGEASRSPARSSRLPACGCSGSQPRPSRSATPSAAIFVWAVPVAACLGALALIFRRAIVARRPAARKEPGVIGRTLSLYLADRFARAVIAAFHAWSSS